MTTGSELSTEETRDRAISVWGTFWSKPANEISDEIMLMTESELEKHFNQTSVDFWLRKRFWEISERSLNTGTKDVMISELCTGICSTVHIYTRVLRQPHRMAWIMLPIHKHMDMIDESFAYLLKKVRNELLPMPVTEKSAPVILKALEFFANRALGPMLQKIEQKTMSVSVDGNQAMREALDPGDMQQKFSELQKKLAAMPIEATKVDEPE